MSNVVRISRKGKVRDINAIDSRTSSLSVR